jgi:hypothetical protein
MKAVEEHVLTQAQINMLRFLVSEHIASGVDVSQYVLDLDEVLNALIHGGKQVILVRYER